MRTPKLVSLLLLLLLLSCKAKQPKIVWIHIYDDIDKLFGNVKQVTLRSNKGDALNVSYVFNIDEEGKQRELNIYFNRSHLKTRFVLKHDQTNNTDDFLGYTKTFVQKNIKSLKNERMNEVYKYDDQGRITKFIKLGGMDSGDSCIYKYNNFSDLIETDEYKNGTLLFKETFKYDSGHLAIESLNTFKGEELDNEKLSYKYKTFDSMGNWLVKIVYSEDGTSTTLTRKITYY